MAMLSSGYAVDLGDEPALIDESGETTWAELDERINRLVHAFRAAGLGAGDTVAIVAGNRREWFELLNAFGHMGVTYVPVNWHWSAEEIAYVLDDSDSTAVIAGHRFVDVVTEALADPLVTGVELSIAIGDTVPTGFAAYEEFLAGGDAAEPDDQQLGGPMFYTSGTTGHPKGVRGALSGATGAAPDLMKLVAAGFGELLPPGGRSLLCGPIYHSAQWAFSWLPMINGSSCVMRHRFDQAEVPRLIDSYGVTNVHLVPTQFKRMIDLPDEVRAEFDGSSLTTVWHGAAPCPPEVKRRMIDWWGPIVNEYYGSTEGSVISTITSEEWLERGGSVGRPLPVMEVIVVDDAGTRVEQGREGTLYFRNLLGTDFEYHKAPEKTAEAHLEPGVFTTGDIGYLDDDGYLWLSDRKIDMIISGGVNIYPAEIEGVLNVHPAVADAAVFGVPDDEFGEQVKAALVLHDGRAPSDELATDILRYCREHLAGYKVPRSVDWADELPRTGTGKIQKRKLRDPYWAGLDRRI
ncbi:MAG: AMP-binding protein [Acidimicrobiia bacterium]|nr:AMP-binding protein [Acidimicrobiia bacterium]